MDVHLGFYDYLDHLVLTSSCHKLMNSWCKYCYCNPNACHGSHHTYFY